MKTIANSRQIAKISLMTILLLVMITTASKTAPDLLADNYLADRFDELRSLSENQSITDFLVSGNSQPDPVAVPHMIGNPAAVYCTDLGYKYQVVSDPNGSQHDTCSLPDGMVCDAWDFLEGKCGQAFSYCNQNGMDMKVMSDGRNPYSRDYAVCLDKDGAIVGAVTSLNEIAPKLYNNCSGDGIPNDSPAISKSESAQVNDDDPYIQNLEQLDSIIPTSWDWRNATYNTVTGDWTTPVRNQGGCGSCWAFSAVGVAESTHNFSSNNPALDLDLAEEYLVSDCEMYNGYQNCCGGWKDEALRFIRDTGIPDEGCMSYVDGGSSGCGCSDGCNSDPGTYTNACNYYGTGQCSDATCSDRCADYASRMVNITATGRVTSNQETIKQALITYGPLAISMNYANTTWDGDILRCSIENGSTNHAVSIVGYDDSGGYWIVKNSWGSSWDGDGFFNLGYGECEAETYVYYATNTPVRTISGYVRTSGGVGISGVAMIGLLNEPVTDSSGYYSGQVLDGSSLVVTPQKTNYTFDPVDRSYSNVTSDQTDQNYTATLSCASGYLCVHVVNAAGTDVPSARVEVYTDLSNNRVASGNTDSSGTKNFSLSSRSYILVVSSSTYHFLVVQDVPALGLVEISPAGTVQVDINVRLLDDSPMSDAIILVHASPYSQGIVGYTNASGSLTTYVTPGSYYFLAWSWTPAYYLITNSTITSPAGLNMHAASMPTAQVAFNLTDFPAGAVYPSHTQSLSIQPVLEIDNGDVLTFSEGSYNIVIELEKEQEPGITWYYQGASNPFTFSSGGSYTVTRGGDFSMTTSAAEATYLPGSAVTINNRVNDATGHRIIYSYYSTDSSSSSSQERFIVQERTDQGGDDIRKQGDQSTIQAAKNAADPVDLIAPDTASTTVYPQYTITDPGGTVISEGNAGWYSNGFTLPSDSQLGIYDIGLSLDTGPHNGVINATNTFSCIATGYRFLLVDDDDNSPDVRSYYTDTLTSLGILFDIWNTGNSDNEPDAAKLADYDTVIWFSGAEWGGYAGPGSSGASALAAWLDGGGCYFLSSQDYHYDRGLTSFSTGYLGLSAATSDVSQTAVTGAGSVFAGLGPYTLGYPIYNFSDNLTPDATAEIAFSGDHGNAAINKTNGIYRTAFFGFPFEAIDSTTDRQNVMRRFLNWCENGSPYWLFLPYVSR